MVKGIEKRIVYLKDTGSPMFDEAYFIVNEKYRDSKRLREGDLIAEATRLIEDSIKKGSRESLRRRMASGLGTLLRRQGLSFIIGVMITVIAVLAIL